MSSSLEYLLANYDGTSNPPPTLPTAATTRRPSWLASPPPAMTSYSAAVASSNGDDLRQLDALERLNRYHERHHRSTAAAAMHPLELEPPRYFAGSSMYHQPRESSASARRGVAEGGNAAADNGSRYSSGEVAAEVSGSNGSLGENEDDSIMTFTRSEDDDDDDDGHHVQMEQGETNGGVLELLQTERRRRPFAETLFPHRGGGTNTAATASERPPAPDKPESATLPTRPRRQAAISCRERISTAIATGGMGRHAHDDDDDAAVLEREHDADELEMEMEMEMPSLQDNSQDRKPSAKHSNHMRNSNRKRNQHVKTMPGKKRKCNQVTTTTTTAEKPSSSHQEEEDDEGPSTCCICLEIPTKEDLASISGCSHPFCFGCIEKWADRENTCPLCKARFSRIEKVHGLKTDEKSKRVNHRDQRTDFSFMNPMEGLFGGMEPATGTWPTHIAQLLFSGLGASSINGGGGLGHRSVRYGDSMPRRTSDTNDNAPSPGASGNGNAWLLRGAGVPAPPRVWGSSRRPTTYTSSLTGAHTTSISTGDREPFTAFLDRVSAHRAEQQQQQLIRLREYVDAQTELYASAAAVREALSSTSVRHTFSESSIHVTHIGPPLGSSSRITETTTTSPLGFSPFGSPASNANAAASDAMPSAASGGASSVLRNPFASINLMRREEEQILGGISPSSYVARLRQMDRDSDTRFHFSVSTSTNSSTDPVVRRTSATADSLYAHRTAAYASSLGGSSAARTESLLGAGRSTRGNNNDEAGRTFETALEIDDSDSDDDDVVEVVAVEAMM